MPIQFRYAPEIRSRFPQLRSGAFPVDGIGTKADNDTAALMSSLAGVLAAIRSAVAVTGLELL